MKTNFTFLCIVLLIAKSFGQEKSMLVFDLANGTQQEIEIPDYDPTISEEKTPYFVGSHDDIIQLLEQTPPETNVYPDSQFTLKRKVAEDYDITAYPLRTSVRLWEYEQGGELENNCSGVFVSKRHIITSAHCVADVNTNTLNVGFMRACPIFNNGNVSDFGCSEVRKIYIFKDWSLGSEDIALLELEEPLGESTGWIGVGFDNDDNKLSEGIFYKFSYPTISFDPLFEYNGDTLYYNYGRVDILKENSMGVQNSTGAGGESGSSYIKIKNEEEYTTFGTLTFAANLAASRITNWKYYSLKNIINDDLVLSTPELDEKDRVILYPNPTRGKLQIKGMSASQISELLLYDNLGRLVLRFKNPEDDFEINVSHLLEGIYFMSVKSDSGTSIIKIVKRG